MCACTGTYMLKKVAKEHLTTVYLCCIKEAVTSPHFTQVSRMPAKELCVSHCVYTSNTVDSCRKQQCPITPQEGLVPPAS